MNRARRSQDFLEARLLRYFLAVAEELHFARAAERLKIEQSPLSRAIRDLELNLAVRLFERTTRNTRLTRAGEVFAIHARRILTAMQQATANVRSAALGKSWQLRVGTAECLAFPWLTDLLVKHTTEEPEVEVVLVELPFHEQVGALRDDLLDVSISFSAEVLDGVVVEEILHEPMVAALPAGHHLATLAKIDLMDLTEQPLVLMANTFRTGGFAQFESIVRRCTNKPRIVKRAESLGAVLTLIAAGAGVGLVGRSQVAVAQRSGLVLRTVHGDAPMLTSYMLRADRELSQAVMRFIDRARSIAQSASADSLFEMPRREQ